MLQHRLLRGHIRSSLDDLEQLINENLQQRELAAGEARSVIAEEVARFLADARAQDLPLLTVGSGDNVIHDWNYLFGKLGVLAHDTQIASAMRVIGWLGMLGIVAWFVWRGLHQTAPPARKEWE